MPNLQAFTVQGSTWKCYGRPGAVQTGWIYGALNSYRPDATKSGIPSSVSQPLPVYPSTGGPYGNIGSTTSGGTTAVPNALVLTTPNVTLQGYFFPCAIIIKASGIKIRNSEIGGGAAPNVGCGLIDATNGAATNWLVEDCKLRATNGTSRWDGVRGDGGTVRRCDISRVTDGFRHGSVANVNVKFYANYVHDMAYDLTDPNQSGGPTHNDGMQFESLVANTTGYDVQGNYFTGLCDPTFLDGASNPATGPNATKQGNAAIQWNPRNGNRFTDITITRNWFGGGGRSINFASGVSSGISGLYRNVKVTNNVFYDTSKVSRGGIIAGTVTFAENNPYGNDIYTGNVWDDNNAAVVPNSGGGW